MLKFNLLQVFFLYLLCSSYSQETNRFYIDELIKQNKETDFDNHLDDILALKEIDSLSRLINYESGIRFSNIGLAYNYNGYLNEKARNHMAVVDSLMVFGEETITDTSLIEYFIIKGKVLGGSGDHLNQLLAFMSADSVCKETNNTYLQSFVDQYLCGYYFTLKDYKNALLYNEKCLKYYNANLPEQKESYLNCLITSGSIHDRLNHHDSTIYYVSKAMDEGSATYINPRFSYLLLGGAYLSKNDLQTAKKYEQLLIAETDTSYNYTVEGILVENFFGKLSVSLNEKKKGLEHYKTALEYAEFIDDDHGKIAGHYNILSTYLSLEENPILLEHLKKYKIEQDSLYFRNSIKLERQLSAQFETQKKELKIEELRFNVEQLNFQNERRRNLLIAIILFALILILSIGIFIVRNKGKRKLYLEKIETEKLQKKLVAKNLKIAQNELNQAINRIKDKSELIDNLQADLKKQSNTPQNIDDIMLILKQRYINENSWAKIILHFDAINDNFSQRVKEKHPNLTNNDIRLLILTKLGYSIKGIAEVNNISEDGVKKRKYRLLKKLNIDSFQSLSEFASAKT